MKSLFQIVNSILCLAVALVLLGFTLTVAEEDREDTYDITLIKTAETDAAPGGEREILEVSGRRVLTEHHSVGEGEWIWQLLRERKLLEKRNLADILDILKKLNPELSNLDRIHPGQKILIPLTLSPAEGVRASLPPAEPEPVTLEDLKDFELKGYTVQPGDSLVKIINRQYEAPDAAFYEKYLSAVRRLNPSVRDVNLIYSGQVIRLPVFTPELVRMPIEGREAVELSPHEIMPELAMEPPPDTAVRISPAPESPDPLRDDLGRLFRALGEEWIQHGQHYIPLKGQGEVNLRADTYPMIDLSNGLKVIVDLHNTLPGDMASLLEKTWDHYRIVHLTEGDDLAGALDRILPECNLGTLIGEEDAVQLGGTIQAKLTADWILRKDGETLLITLLDGNTPPTPGPVREYLARQGVRIIDFPPARVGEDALPKAGAVLGSGPDLSSLVETLLDLNRLDFMRNVEIPVYEKQEGVDFNLFVKADYLLEKEGQKFILDLSGAGSGIMTLLRERELSYLSLAGEKDPLRALSRLLEFLGIPFEPGPLEVMAAARNEGQNIRFRIPGASFRDSAGRRLLATTLDLPEEIRRLLTEKGYHVLRLSPV
ncbi:MAG: LysM peptidoglycan-binding domain-containing protein [Thermodesulfobacteriota bacterium]